MNMLHVWSLPPRSVWPLPFATRRYWRTVARFALLGPLIGGAPYAVFVVTIPFVYAFGLGPAVVTGALYAAWSDWPGPRRAPVSWRVAMGVLCAAVGCAAIAMAVQPRSALEAWAFLAAHGVPAAAILALKAEGADTLADEPRAATDERLAST